LRYRVTFTSPARDAGLAILPRHACDQCRCDSALRVGRSDVLTASRCWFISSPPRGAGQLAAPRVAGLPMLEEGGPSLFSIFSMWQRLSPVTTPATLIDSRSRQRFCSTPGRESEPQQTPCAVPGRPPFLILVLFPECRWSLRGEQRPPQRARPFLMSDLLSRCRDSIRDWVSRLLYVTPSFPGGRCFFPDFLRTPVTFLVAWARLSLLLRFRTLLLWEKFFLLMYVLFYQQFSFPHNR